MHETPDELAALQQLLDRSFEGSSPHLLSIMEPQRRLGAARLSADLPSPAVLDIATVTSRGEPRISAVDGHFLHGRWYFTTMPEAPKARHLDERPAISAAYTPRDGFGVFCHGTAVLLSGDDKLQLLEHLAVVYGTAPEDWAEVAAYRIDPHWMTGFAMTDAEMVEIEAHRAELAARGAQADDGRAG